MYRCKSPLVEVTIYLKSGVTSGVKSNDWWSSILIYYLGIRENRCAAIPSDIASTIIQICLKVMDTLDQIATEVYKQSTMSVHVGSSCSIEYSLSRRNLGAVVGYSPELQALLKTRLHIQIGCVLQEAMHAGWSFGDLLQSPPSFAIRLHCSDSIRIRSVRAAHGWEVMALHLRLKLYELSLAFVPFLFIPLGILLIFVRFLFPPLSPEILETEALDGGVQYIIFGAKCFEPLWIRTPSISSTIFWSVSNFSFSESRRRFSFIAWLALASSLFFAFRTPGESLASLESRSWVEIEEVWLARRSESDWNEVETLDELGVVGYPTPRDSW